MRKIINGVIFDTDKMELIIQDKNRRGYITSLYRGKKRYAIKEPEVYGGHILRELQEDQFKKILADFSINKYLELYPDTEEA
ncbi:hypothetical protein [Peptostreptococcus equinus]|uniref:Uncharacterized protein n=1 Tax=Peptostreptococcus equinus TaxID=3003601 RepID=A0ABY7JNL4_9FIRM|nr:hypothetical protein [Peptostreptococcus sp. CBA3647]WAW14764.1 hypothetical protein O0R46_09290 [Peptostreptococcus sp. CBA3647]